MDTLLITWLKLGGDFAMREPKECFLISLAFLLGYLIPQFTSIEHDWSRFASLLIASIAWGVNGVNEWSVQVTRADIRVDLFFIPPILAVITTCALLRIVCALCLILRSTN